ncbi:MAG: winged helix-turn-helix transcriptional regulator [Polyangiales bacterium]
MERRQFRTAPCSVARALDIVGDWWNPLIIRECLYGVHRFDALQRWLGIGRNILTRRLQTLVQQGVLERRQYQERPTRVEYHLTDKGYEAAKVMLAMMPFGESCCFAPGEEPIHLYSRRTGTRVQPLLVDAQTGQPLDPRHVYAGPGPSFPADESLRRARFVDYYRRQEALQSGETTTSTVTKVRSRRNSK